MNEQHEFSYRGGTQGEAPGGDNLPGSVLEQATYVGINGNVRFCGAIVEAIIETAGKGNGDDVVKRLRWQGTLILDSLGHGVVYFESAVKV
jgi:hypothetical protein